MSINQSPSLVYHYNITKIAIGICGIILFSLVDLYLLFFFVGHHDRWYVLYWIIAVYFTVFAVGAALCRTAIEINNVGIAACILGIKSRVIKWQDIKMIIKFRGSNGYQYVDTYLVHENRDQNIVIRGFINILGHVVFTQEIDELRDLLNRINFFAKQYGIPLAVRDMQASASKLAEEKNLGYWRMLIKRAQEVRVTEF